MAGENQYASAGLQRRAEQARTRSAPRASRDAAAAASRLRVAEVPSDRRHGSEEAAGRTIIESLGDADVRELVRAVVRARRSSAPRARGAATEMDDETAGRRRVSRGRSEGPGAVSVHEAHTARGAPATRHVREQPATARVTAREEQHLARAGPPAEQAQTEQRTARSAHRERHVEVISVDLTEAASRAAPQDDGASRRARLDPTAQRIRERLDAAGGDDAAGPVRERPRRVSGLHASAAPSASNPAPREAPRTQLPLRGDDAAHVDLSDERAAMPSIRERGRSQRAADSEARGRGPRERDPGRGPAPRGRPLQMPPPPRPSPVGGGTGQNAAVSIFPGRAAYPDIGDDSSWDAIYLNRPAPVVEPEFDFVWFGSPGHQPQGADRPRARASDVPPPPRPAPPRLSRVRAALVDDGGHAAATADSPTRLTHVRQPPSAAMRRDFIDELAAAQAAAEEAIASEAMAAAIRRTRHARAVQQLEPQPGPRGAAPAVRDAGPLAGDPSEWTYEQMLRLDEGIAARGMSAADLARLEVVVFQKRPPTAADRRSASRKATHAKAGVLETCTICLEEYASGEGVWKLPCKHIFHVACVRKHFETSTKCPNCRFECRIES